MKKYLSEEYQDFYSEIYDNSVRCIDPLWVDIQTSNNGNKVVVAYFSICLFAPYDGAESVYYNQKIYGADAILHQLDDPYNTGDTEKLKKEVLALAKKAKAEYKKSQL